MKKLYIGVMSGTSLDGVDIAFCEIDASGCRLLEYYEESFPLSLKNEILESVHSQITLRDIGILDQKLGKLYASAILTFLEEKKISASSIEAIGLHGQTLWHEPQGEYPFSMQLGSASLVTSQTNITTVSDFRSMDLANGGQGAPFAPAFHKFLFASSTRRAIVNIGGMANITLFEPTLKGWDSGCGNVLLDLWMQEKEDKPYDADGQFAKSGVVHQALLDSMLSDAYFKKSAPKSTGREHFNKLWLESHLSKFDSLKSTDIARTLLELTAITISDDLKEIDLEELIVCGGGSKNAFLLQRLQELGSYAVKPSDTLSESADALEAMAFAWFAYKRMHSEVVELKSVTGAKKDSLLGAIYG